MDVGVDQTRHHRTSGGVALLGPIRQPQALHRRHSGNRAPLYEHVGVLERCDVGRADHATPCECERRTDCHTPNPSTPAGARLLDASLLLTPSAAASSRSSAAKRPVMSSHNCAPPSAVAPFASPRAPVSVISLKRKTSP